MGKAIAYPHVVGKPVMKTSSRLFIGFGVVLLAQCLISIRIVPHLPAAERSSAMLAAAAVLLISGAIAWWTCSRILHSQDAVTLIGKSIANGHLAMPLAAGTSGDAAHLLRILREIAESIFQMVSEVRNGTSAIANAAAQISTEHSALSNRTQTQSDALQTTAASIEELTSAVSHNAENSLDASRLAHLASEFARDGGGLMTKVVSNMESIKSSSSKITEITGVIDAIAFQTDILALNAAVEAALAGERGRGFSVVAMEVRNLARRSAEAAREVKLLITDSAEKVDAGHALVAQAGHHMEKIIDSTLQVSELLGAIAASITQQRVGIEQINGAVIQIEGFTQENSSLVEGAIIAARRLQEKAVALTAAVSAFDLGPREFGSRDEAVAMVAKAATHIAASGRAQVLAQINAGDSGFRDRDLYIAVIDSSSLTLVAHGATPQLIGADVRRLKDSDGKYFAKEAVSLAARKGRGWVDYKFEHPVTREMRHKSTYSEALGDLVIQCGIYLP